MIEREIEIGTEKDEKKEMETGKGKEEKMEVEKEEAIKKVKDKEK